MKDTYRIQNVYLSQKTGELVMAVAHIRQTLTRKNGRVRPSEIIEEAIEAYKDTLVKKTPGLKEILLSMS